MDGEWRPSRKGVGREIEGARNKSHVGGNDTNICGVKLRQPKAVSAKIASLTVRLAIFRETNKDANFEG